MFTRNSESLNNFLRVVIYINIRLSSFHFSLCKDVINHKDILLVSFFNNNNVFWLINIYSDSFHLALKYLKDTEVDIHNLLIMTGDFNIWDSLCVMGRLGHEQFLFSFSFIFWLYRDFVFFSFGWWRGTWHRSHMMCHMMWRHKA